MIEISHLTKKYGTHVAVDDLNLTIEPGRIYGFLGPNGAGKSTTMNMITGYLGATEGIIKINGFDILAQPEDAKKCIGYLPELPPLYMDMTVEEYLLFAAELKKIPKEKRKPYVEDAMATTKITDMRGRLIKNLSKGYRQRVGLAQAVLGYPEVIILDEPTVGLDPKQIIEIRDLIQSLGKKHTVILSSHILSEVRAVCDYIFIISHGKLVASEETEELVERMSGGQVIELKLKAEEEKVLKALTDNLRENYREIVKDYEIAKRLDSLIGAVNYGNTYKGNIASINEEKLLLEDLFHPLLDVPVIVSNTVRLNKVDGKIMVVTGPNAGGKTVLLKSVALAVLMNQHGLLDLMRISFINKVCQPDIYWVLG